MYGLIWVRTENFFFYVFISFPLINLKFVIYFFSKKRYILCACMKSLKMMGLSLALFGLRAMAHLARFRSMCAPSAKFLEFVDLMLEVVYVVCEDGYVVYVCHDGVCAFGSVKLITW